MPLPKRKEDENKNDFISRCMGDSTMNKEYPESSQRMAICMNQSKSDLLESVCANIEYDTYGFTEELNENNIIIPSPEDYEDFGETTEEYEISVAAYIYEDIISGELFYFQRMGVYKKNNRTLVLVSKAAEYQGRKVTLNKPFRTPDGPKKTSVYVKNEKGNVVKVNFGDPNMKIKKNIPGRRKNFRARHNCDNPGPKWKARYWSCKAW
jgi:hypothetical protein